MSLITVELPKSLYMKISELSEAEGISANQFLVLAAAEKMSAILTENYLKEEARRGRREDFEKVMKAVPCAEPEDHVDGGERGIRTLGTAFGSTHDFQSCSFGQLGHLSVKKIYMGCASHRGGEGGI